ALHSEAAERAPYTMLVVPLFFETLAYRTCAHRTLLVDCPVGSQMERVKRRPGLDALDARRIIDAQLPRTIRLQLADDLIWNGKMVETLVPQVGELHSRYLCVAAKAA
ncbi:MAG: dephospho-CoA kinase, partial [Burkholderiales bacterium]|nr:dephospho-CoA kinase [Burkholderiales bacterium]